MLHIYPSLIASNLLDLQKTITQLNPYCPGYHLDVMDDHFVPNLTWGPAFVNAIAQASANHLMWVHLMVEKPTSFADRLSLNPGSMITFHQETKENHDSLIEKIQKKGWRAGIALNPSTRIETIFSYTHTLDHVLIMSVEPGFSGQNFLPMTFEKISQLHDYKKQHRLSFTIAVDGGITKENIKKLATGGATIFGVASAIFDNNDPVNALQKLQKESGL